VENADDAMVQTRLLGFYKILNAVDVMALEIVRAVEE